MKAILVIDMPNDCLECDLAHNGEFYCVITNSDCCARSRAKDCPLKPMLQKKEIEWSDSFGKHNYKKGFNECIDEILGEE